MCRQETRIKRAVMVLSGDWLISNEPHVPLVREIATDHIEKATWRTFASLFSLEIGCTLKLKFGQEMGKYLVDQIPAKKR